MKKKTFKVTVDEIISNTYWFTIEANDEVEAERLVLEEDFWSADNYTQNRPDYEVVEIEEI